MHSYTGYVNDQEKLLFKLLLLHTTSPAEMKGYRSQRILSFCHSWNSKPKLLGHFPFNENGSPIKLLLQGQGQSEGYNSNLIQLQSYSDVVQRFLNQ